MRNNDLVAEVAHDAAADAGEADVADVGHQPAPHPHRREQPHHLLARHQAVPLAPARRPRTRSRPGGSGGGALGHVGRREAAGPDLLVLLVGRRRRVVALDGCGARAPAAAAHQAGRPQRQAAAATTVLVVRRRARARLEPPPAGDGGAPDLPVGGLVEPGRVQRAGARRRRRLHSRRRVQGRPAERAAGRWSFRCRGRGGVGRPVQRLVDERHPSRRRLVVLDHQHVAGVQRDHFLEPALHRFQLWRR